MAQDSQTFASLDDLADNLRQSPKKNILLFAHNGTGKTRLSVAFKNRGKQANVGGDTLYFNAFTEDLFHWENDLVNDEKRELKFNKNSHFFDGLSELELTNRIRPLLGRYADFDFTLDHDNGSVAFSRQELIEGRLYCSP